MPETQEPQVAAAIIHVVVTELSGDSCLSTHYLTQEQLDKIAASDKLGHGDGLAEWCAGAIAKEVESLP